MAGRPFKMLAVNQGEALEQVRRFAAKHRYSFDLVLDPIGDIGSSYGANRLPMTYIIDKQGFVIRRAVGPREWDGEAALQLFNALIAAPATAPAAASVSSAAR
jgi:peroxiredoxin